ncbi:MAG: hypothetical protein Q4E19_05060 [Ligilactobacillus salivarius]|nr:hypothetical protein [Ligilactobacillus salivarius]
MKEINKKVKSKTNKNQTVTSQEKENISLNVSRLIDQGIKENRELLEWLKDK